MGFSITEVKWKEPEQFCYLKPLAKYFVRLTLNRYAVTNYGQNLFYFPCWISPGYV